MTDVASASVIPEPTLLFGESFPAPDPKLGLSLYGPYSGRESITVGIIGDKETIAQTVQILDRCRGSINGPTRFPTWTPDFPGMSPQSPLACEIITSDKWYQTISSNELDQLDKMTRVQEIVSYSADLFVKRLTNLKEREESPSVVICAPPKRMMDLCIPEDEPFAKGYGKQSKYGASRAPKYLSTSTSLLDFMPEFKAEKEALLLRMSVENFHHLLKAKAMGIRIPTQMILPYTLRSFTSSEGSKGQDEATFAWNLCTALIYKAGGRPWRLAEIPTGTCFVGISFYREKAIYGGKVGTSMAQVFTPEGEGLVLKGERFDWPHNRSPRLDEESSKRLAEKALALYEQHTKQKPARVVVHKSSRFSAQELSGFKNALSSIPTYDLLAINVRQRRIQFFRSGYNPVLRGTVVHFPDDTWLLYTKGFVPFLKLYPGPRAPRPVEVLQHVGDTPFDLLSKEILGLTRLNWNTADFCCQLPITLQFSRQVGTILRELPLGVTPETRYLYYM